MIGHTVFLNLVHHIAGRVGESQSLWKVPVEQNMDENYVLGSICKQHVFRYHAELPNPVPDRCTKHITFS